MEDAISVHVVDGLAKLVHVQLDPLFRQVALAICKDIGDRNSHMYTHTHKNVHTMYTYSRWVVRKSVLRPNQNPSVVAQFGQL